MKHVLSLAALLAAALACRAADELKPLTGVAYGKHARQVLDFYPAKSDKPTPVVFHIHGGGWRNGDKKKNFKPDVFLAKGISVLALQQLAELHHRVQRSS